MSWKQGLCGCCSNCGNCWYGMCCPCCAVGKVAEKVGESNCLYCCLTCLIAPIPICLVREKVRNKYAIPGGLGGDCCVSFCCGCCGVVQMLNQVEGDAMAYDDIPICSQPHRQEDTTVITEEKMLPQA